VARPIAQDSGFPLFSMCHFSMCHSGCGQQKAGTGIGPSNRACRHSLDVIIPLGFVIIMPYTLTGKYTYRKVRWVLLAHRTQSRCSWRRALDHVMNKHCEWLGVMPSLKRDASRLEPCVPRTVSCNFQKVLDAVPGPSRKTAQHHTPKPACCQALLRSLCDISVITSFVLTLARLRLALYPALPSLAQRRAHHCFST